MSHGTKHAEEVIHCMLHMKNSVGLLTWLECRIDNIRLSPAKDRKALMKFDALIKSPTQNKSINLHFLDQWFFSYSNFKM